MIGENIFRGIPASLPEELTSRLVEGTNVRIERIVSRGHRSPAGFWYDQPENEWVMVLEGSATVAFDDGSRVRLGPGDWIDIPSRRRHRVEETRMDCNTVWLAVFY